MQTQQHNLDTLRKKIHDLNAMNDRLTAKYFGDKKFMRVHKRLAGQFSSQTMLHELLIKRKQTIDGKLFSNYAVLDNSPYFEVNVRRDVKMIFDNLPVSTTRNIAEIVTQEYIDERNATL